MKRVVLIALLLYGGSARSAPQMLPTSPTPLVTVSVATGDTLPRLDSETVQKFHPNAFVLTNVSNRDVVGIVVRWTYLDAASKERATYYMNQDSFIRTHTPPTVAAGTRLLVAPGVFLPETLATTTHIGPPLAKMDGTLHREMQGASQVEATIQTLLFSDGEVVGPNETHYDTQVENRKMAAVTLAREVRSAMAKGQDTKTVLLNALASQPDRDDSLGRWRVRYASMLAKTRNFDTVLTNIENLPDPPKFFRDGASR